MKLSVDESPTYDDVNVTIQCPSVNGELRGLIERIKQYGLTLRCKKDDSTYLIKRSDVLYIESVDDKTFVYCEREVYRSDMRLYALEQALPSDIFVRVKKNCILNTEYILNFRSALNGKIEACLTNGERVEIARHYVQALKQRLTETEARQ